MASVLSSCALRLQSWELKATYHSIDTPPARPQLKKSFWDAPSLQVHSTNHHHRRRRRRRSLTIDPSDALLNIGPPSAPLPYTKGKNVTMMQRRMVSHLFYSSTTFRCPLPSSRFLIEIRPCIYHPVPSPHFLFPFSLFFDFFF